MMMPVLVTVLVMQTALGLILVSKVPPLEKLACWIIDLTRTTKGSAVTKTLGGTLLIVLASSISTYVKTQSHMYNAHTSGEGHMHVGQAEMFILRSAELETTISGFILILTLMINRVHYYLRGKRGLTLQLEVLMKQSKSAQAEYLRLKEERSAVPTNDESIEEIKALKEIIAELREKVEKLQIDVRTKEKEVKAAEVSAQAIRKQSEGMALEYERLLGDNENLRIQVSSFDREHSKSSYKKDT